MDKTATSFSLVQLQQWLQAALMPSPTPDALTETMVRASSRLSAGRHLDIYRHSYIARLRECMRSQFSALAYALGNELFELFADQYLDAHPSESYTLNDLGRHFAAFLETTRPDADAAIREDWPDFMIGLAHFEYTLSALFDRHAAEDFVLADMDTPDEQLALIPVFQLFHHAFPICHYYLSYSRQEQPELPLPEESYCVVTRVNYKLGLHMIRPAQYYFLQYMAEDDSIATAKDRLVATLGIDRDELERIWPTWKSFFTTSGFFCKRR